MGRLLYSYTGVWRELKQQRKENRAGSEPMLSVTPVAVE
jgi:hypothetical protein